VGVSEGVTVSEAVLEGVVVEVGEGETEGVCDLVAPVDGVLVPVRELLGVSLGVRVPVAV